MITSALGFHISADGGRVAVKRYKDPKVPRLGFVGSKLVGFAGARYVGFLAEDKKSIILDARGAVAGHVRHGDALVPV